MRVQEYCSTFAPEFISMQITLTIQKSKVYEEVAQTTDYTGAKLEGDTTGEAYDRIKTVDEDESELERFWNESRADIVNTLIEVLESEGMYVLNNTTYTADETGDYYRLTLNMTSLFPSSTDDADKHTSLLRSMEHSLFSFFVNSIMVKWCLYAQPSLTDKYSVLSSVELKKLRKKVYFRQRPKRPTN